MHDPEKRPPTSRRDARILLFGLLVAVGAGVLVWRAGTDTATGVKIVAASFGGVVVLLKTILD